MNSGAPTTAKPLLVSMPKPRGRLFRKYVTLLVSIVCAALTVNSIFELWFSYQEEKRLFVRIQQKEAESAANKITQFLREIEGQMTWTVQFPWVDGDLEERHIDLVRLLRQVRAITEVSQLDPAGRELLRVSRSEGDVVGGHVDFSRDPRFVDALQKKVYHGPVFFKAQSEPHMVLAVSGSSPSTGVTIAEVNLKFTWDLVSQIKIGEHGEAYLVDAAGRLIAHPDISLVLRNMDVSRLEQVQATYQSSAGVNSDFLHATAGIHGDSVFATFAAVTPVGWSLLVELPSNEVYATLYLSIVRSGTLLLAALALAFVAALFLARRMVIPIQALRLGAAKIGSGDLAQHISIKTGDELEALGDQFNSMAAQLQDSYANLERKVDERTHQLELANLAKSRFLAAASHDLRQPLHALGLFVAQLQAQSDLSEHPRIIRRIDAAVAAMNELFNALLDISKLDAGILSPDIVAFPVAHVLRRLETTFSEAAREKGLSLRVVSSQKWICSDAILLERVLLNLIANAIRYTSRGGVVVGCRMRAGQLAIDVCDSGPGIPDDQRHNIFAEFYQVSAAKHHGGLGLGLAIVDRLCRLLGHKVELASTLGKGSRFSVTVPAAQALSSSIEQLTIAPRSINAFSGKLVVVLDDDLMVLESMSGLLQSWNCHVVSADSSSLALLRLREFERTPDLVISDYHLSDGKSGIDEIKQLREILGSSIPAFLISGDIAPERLQESRKYGYHLLHKPVRPMALRAMLTKVFGSQLAVSAGPRDL
jgi:signal transduction histidine kinase